MDFGGLDTAVEVQLPVEVEEENEVPILQDKVLEGSKSIYSRDTVFQNGGEVFLLPPTMEELVLGMALAMPDTTANCWWVVFFWQFIAKKMCINHGSRLILNRVDISSLVAAGLVAREAPSLDDSSRSGSSSWRSSGHASVHAPGPQDRLVFSARVSGPRGRL